MKCPQCNQSISAKAQFCPKCGAKIQQQQQTQQPKTMTSNKSFSIGEFVKGIITLGIIAGAIFLAVNNIMVGVGASAGAAMLIKEMWKD